MPKSSRKENPVLEDMARMAEGALHTLAGFRSELERGCKQQAEWVKDRLKMPTDEDIAVIRAMQVKLLEQQEAILKRLDALEAEGK